MEATIESPRQTTGGRTIPIHSITWRQTGLTLAAASVLVVAACQPRVAVEPPKEPITINLNVKLDADIRVRLEEQAREDIEANPDIF